MLFKLSSGKLARNEQRYLLNQAREVIFARLNGQTPPPHVVKTSRLNQNHGAFVTLTKNKQLRGCIGFLQAAKPLYQTIADVAEAAAFQDPRFQPVKKEEMSDISIEISVIRDIRKISSIKKIKVNRHGVMIKKGQQQGVLLPQVAVKNRWSRETLLENVCMKAKLEKNSWREPDSEIMIFEAQVFKE